MNQTETIAAISAASNVSKADVERVLKEQGTVVHNTLAGGGEVTLPGLGKFSTNNRAARNGRNPRTGEIVPIAAKRVPHFSAAKALKDAAA